MSDSAAWSVADSRRLYHVDGWGAGYFDINAAGEVVMKAGRDSLERGLSLPGLVSRLQSEGIQLPVLVRFEEILKERVARLTSAFDGARSELDFAGDYTAVYPIKVNQQRSVLEQILLHGDQRVGLEAGSKPELLAVLAWVRDGGTIVCNGYKDREYIRLALMAQMLGSRVFIVVEKPGELSNVFNVADELGVEPRIGVRVRLASLGKGNWQNTGGEKGKFGLTSEQLLHLVDQLKQRGKLHWLQLLHFHMGSQLSDIADIRQGVNEAGQFLRELSALGVAFKVFDVGGGLGVDYEGLHSEHECSINYTLRDYANVVVSTLKGICDSSGLPAPEIFTEAGRAMTAHHAVLITDIVDIDPCRIDADEKGLFADIEAQEGELDADALLQLAVKTMREMQARFNQQQVSLAERAQWESAFKAFCAGLLARHPETATALEIEDRLADKLFLNFSLFQSIPDAWALEQIFPVLPLSRLGEKPTRLAVLEDLTCDSDGRIEQLAHSGSIHATLPVHAFRHVAEAPLIGIFLVGAYQEILGDIHNLFGDTYSVNVRNTADGYELVDEESPDTVSELLSYVHLSADALMRRARRKMAAAGLSEASRRQITGALSSLLGGYSYLRNERD